MSVFIGFAGILPFSQKGFRNPNRYKDKVYLRYTVAKMTTIKLQYATKTKLDKLKRKKESYEDVIRKLAEEKIREKTLILAYKESAASDSKTAKELEGTLGDGL